jgi:hypothetical protein
MADVTPVVVDSKKWWQSKTIWTNLIMAVAAFIPSVNAWIVANPTMIALAFVIINLILRAVTKSAIDPIV